MENENPKLQRYYGSSQDRTKADWSHRVCSPPSIGTFAGGTLMYYCVVALSVVRNLALMVQIVGSGVARLSNLPGSSTPQYLRPAIIICT
jgi:hypothetical protein